MTTAPNLKFVPTFSEIWERGRYSIPTFARDFLDLEVFEHQRHWFEDSVWAVERVFVAGNRSGKGQMGDAQILTPTGWRRMGDLRVGDLVYSQDGKPTEIVGVFNQGVKQAYKLTFDDDVSIVVSEDHLWQVRTARERFRKNYNDNRPERKNKVAENTQYRKWTVLDTKTILDRWGAEPRPKNRVTIPVVEPVEFAHQDVPIDPYVLGLLLGNGCFPVAGKVMYTTSDPETLDAFESRPNYVGKYDYAVAGLRDSVDELGLTHHRSWEKFVPKQYLWNDAPTRLAVLRGLMDTDGTTDKNKSTVEYSTASEQLAKDVRFIVQSLGGKCKIKSRIPHFTYKGERKTGRVSYRVTFHIPNTNPFKLKRKADAWSEKETTQERILIKIEDAGFQDCICIAVANPSHLYVANDFIVTHNTFSAAIKHLHHILYQTRAPKYAGQTQRYIRVNVALSLDMAQIAYQIAVNRAQDSPLYRQFILEDECKAYPFPSFVVGDGKRGKKGFRSELWARSTASGAKFLLGKDLDGVNYDEAAFQPDGRDVVEKVLLMRLADRSGQMDYTSSPNGKNWFFDLFEQTQKPPALMQPPNYYYGMIATSYDNKAIDHDRLRINESRFSEAERKQNIMGVFADVNGVFSGASIEACYRGVDYPMPVNPHPGAQYVKGWDFAASRDLTVGIVARVDVKPAQVVYVGWWGGEGSGVGFVGPEGIYEQVARIHSLYPGPTYGDSTGPAGKIILETLTKQYGVPMRESDIAGSRGRPKENLIAAGRQALDAKSIIFPYSPSTERLIAQLRYYQMEDKNIATDFVMAFCILAEAMRKEGLGEVPPPEESGAVWGTSSIGPLIDGCDCEFNSDFTWCRKHHLPVTLGEACCHGEPSVVIASVEMPKVITPSDLF